MTSLFSQSSVFIRSRNLHNFTMRKVTFTNVLAILRERHNLLNCLLNHLNKEYWPPRPRDLGTFSVVLDSDWEARRSRLFANHLLSVLVYFCVEKSKIATPILCPWNYGVYLAFRLKKRKTEMKSKDRGKDRKRHPKSKVSWSIVLFFSHFLWMDFQGAQSFRENWR